MSELTQAMRPICVGRLILEIPAVATIDSWKQEIDSIKIFSINPPSHSQKAFDIKLRQLEIELKASPHETEGVRFKTKTQLTPERMIFVYRRDAGDTTGYKLEAFFWHPNIEYKFEKSTTNKYLDSAISRISKLTKSFVAIPVMNPATTPPGFCLENGVFTDTGTEFRGEDITIKGSIKEYPGLKFEFTTGSTNKKFDDKTLLQRHESSYGLGDAMAISMIAATKYLRKGKRTLNGQAGEELAASFKLDGQTSMNGTAEFYGEPNVLEKPMIEITLDYDPSEDGTHQPGGKTLSEKEFLALWDSLLNGIRPRKLSLWGGLTPR